MPPLALSDEEMTLIRTAAEAVPRAQRDDFLRRVAAELEQRQPGELGVGLVARIARALQLEPQFRPDVAVGPSPRAREPRQAAQDGPPSRLNQKST